MNDLIVEVFSPYVKSAPDGVPRMDDGRTIAANSAAVQIAKGLAAKDPVLFADEIIKLMKPLCMRFDVDEVRSIILDWAAENVTERASLEEEEVTGRLLA